MTRKANAGKPEKPCNRGLVLMYEVAEAGLERNLNSSRKTTFHEGRGTESGALSAQLRVSDPELAVVNGWDSLPKALKAGILVMIRAAE